MRSVAAYIAAACLLVAAVSANAVVRGCGTIFGEQTIVEINIDTNELSLMIAFTQPSGDDVGCLVTATPAVTQHAGDTTLVFTNYSAAKTVGNAECSMHISVDQVIANREKGGSGLRLASVTGTGAFGLPWSLQALNSNKSCTHSARVGNNDVFCAEKAKDIVIRAELVMGKFSATKYEKVNGKYAASCTLLAPYTLENATKAQINAGFDSVVVTYGQPLEVPAYCAATAFPSLGNRVLLNTDTLAVNFTGVMASTHKCFSATFAPAENNAASCGDSCIALISIGGAFGIFCILMICYKTRKAQMARDGQSEYMNLLNNPPSERRVSIKE